MDFEFNANQIVKVKLTDEGIDVLKEKRNALNKLIKSKGGKGLEDYQVRVDDEGYTSFQLWALMEDLGPYCGLLKKQPFALDMIFVGGREMVCDETK